MLDDRTVLKHVDGRFHRMWNQKSNAYGWRSYLGRAPGSPEVTDHAAPARRESFVGLPPAWIGVGTLDLFHDEDLAYAARLREAGVPTSVEIVEGAFHGFDAVMPKRPVSERFFDAQVAAIETRIALREAEPRLRAARSSSIRAPRASCTLGSSRRCRTRRPTEDAPMAYDLVIRNGTLIDGTGAAPRAGDVAIQDGRIAAVGRGLGRRRAHARRRRARRDAGLRRHPHPLRRPGHLGPAARAVLLPRRHHGRDGQLRRRLRAGAARTSTTS